MILSSFFGEEKKLLDANFGKANDEYEDEVFRIWKTCKVGVLLQYAFGEERKRACMCIQIKPCFLSLVVGNLP